MSEPSLASLLERTQPRSRPLDPESRVEADDYRAFAFGRVGNRAQQRVEFRKADGFRLVLPYVDLKSIESNDPSIGFILNFLDRQIKVEGKNLNDCYEYLRQDRIAGIFEAGRSMAMQSPETDSLIVRLVISG